MVEQVRGKGMAQGVRRQGRGDARLQGVFFDQVPKHGARHRPTGQGAALGHKHRIGGRAAQQSRTGLRQVAVEPLAGHLAKRHQALFVALAQNLDHALAHPQLVQLQADQLAHPQAAGVHQLQHGAVAHAQIGVAGGRGQQGLDLGFRHALGHAQRLLGRQDAQGRVSAEVVFAQTPAVKALEHRQAPVGCAGAGVVVAVGKVGLQMGLLHTQQIQALGLQPL